MSFETKCHVLLHRKEIAIAVKRLAEAITADYRGKTPLLIGILKGSFVFLSDLMRSLDFPVEVEFVRLSSYGKKSTSSGKVSLVQGLRTDVTGRDVIVVEDIIDTGLTVAYLLHYLKKKKPASLRLCALTDKPSRRKVPVHIDYLGFTVPNKFLVGYGLDWNEKYRNLPDICYIQTEGK